MSRLVRMMARVVMTVAVCGLAFLIVAPSTTVNPPYVSALSTITTGNLFAAPRCEFKQCRVKRPSGNLACVSDKTVPHNCTLISATQCSDTAC